MPKAKGTAKEKKSGADTPVMRQYLAAKAEHPDALMFFRMGDFYELFFEDAVTAARALDLTLTSRNKNAAEEIPMAGVPHHAASAYVQRLLEQGYRVALCEQMADPATVKGIVPREVVRVVSPGIAFDDQGLEPRENHFLAAVARQGELYGVAALDVSTGELLCAEVEGESAVLAEIVRFEPKELLLESSAAELGERFTRERPKLRTTVSATPFADSLPVLHRSIAEDECLRLQPSAIARHAAASLCALLRSAEPKLQELPLRLVAHVPGDHLLLDENTQAHLELCRTLAGEREAALLAQLDRTRTAAGARLLRRRLLAPLRDVASIRRRHDRVEALVVASGERDDLQRLLGSVADLERLGVKLCTGRVEPKDLGALRRSLRLLPEVVAVLGRATPPIGAEHIEVDLGDDLLRRLESALEDELPVRLGDGPTFRKGFDAALDEARDLREHGEQKLLELEAKLRQESQIANAKLRYTRVFGWYLEVTRSQLARAPSHWRRKQTVANAERFTTDELDELSERIANAEADTSMREASLHRALVAELAVAADRLRAMMAYLADWDVAAALAEVAHRHDYVRPEVDHSLALHVEDGRHPVVERLAGANRFVPNDCLLDADGSDKDAARFWLLTGPNMAGKSTFMRQVALIVILAQMGSFVPARRARIGVVDRVLTRVGASDNLARGESTFMVEMKETAHVLRSASSRSLVVLDEIGRGTSTFDGLAIAWAVAEHLHDTLKCRALFATHYHELTRLVVERPTAENYCVSAREHQGELVFLHALERGASSRSYGVACARLAGVPQTVLERAKSLLAELEAQGARQGRSRANSAQLGLFGSVQAPEPKPPRQETPAAVLALANELASLDIDLTTPLDALRQLAQLKDKAARATRIS